MVRVLFNRPGALSRAEGYRTKGGAIMFWPSCPCDFPLFLVLVQLKINASRERFKLGGWEGALREASNYKFQVVAFLRAPTMEDNDNIWSSSSSSGSTCYSISDFPGRDRNSVGVHDSVDMAGVGNLSSWHEKMRSTPVVSDSQFSQDFSQGPHNMSNAEFMALMNDPPLVSRFPAPQLLPVASSGPFFSQSTSFDQKSCLGNPFWSEASQEIPSMQMRQASKNARVAPTSSEGAIARKKRVAGRKSSKKAKKAKNIDADQEGDEDVDESSTIRWEDADVIQLIAFRSEMDEEFKLNAKKQGINMWEKLQIKMIAACDNFTKSAEACQKKWIAIYRQYCTNKWLLQISGEGRKVTCKFFEHIDQGFNNLLNVRKLIHSDTRGTPNPCPPDLNEPCEAQGSAENISEPGVSISGPQPSFDSSTLSRTGKRSSGEHMSAMMCDMVQSTKEMVSQTSAMVIQTTSIATDIHENTSVLKELKTHLARLIDKL